MIGARLTAWIAHPGAPELHLEHLRVVGGALDADLMQSNPVSFAGEVELGVWRGTKLASTTDLLAVHRVAFAAGSTHVTFRVPREGDTVDVDPLVRLPRRLPPDNWWGNGLRVNLHEVP